MHDRALFLLGTGTSIKSGWVKQILCLSMALRFGICIYSSVHDLPFLIFQLPLKWGMTLISPRGYHSVVSVFGTIIVYQIYLLLKCTVPK